MGRKLIDLTNKKFGRLIVLYRGENSSGGAVRWVCKCDCGSILNIQGGNLKSGQTTSCGCYIKEITSKRSKTHGMTNSPEFISWQSMLGRCNDINNPAFCNYGGRGITVCDRWKESFENFYEDMGPRLSDEYSIDRINNGGNYEPDNCRWSSRKEQARNRRSTVIKDLKQANEIREKYKKNRVLQKDLAEEYNCSIKTISEIINYDTWKN